MNTKIDEQRVHAPLANAGLTTTVLHLFDELASTSRWLGEYAIDDKACNTKCNESAGSDLTAGRLDDQLDLYRADEILFNSAAHLCATHWQSSGIARRGRTWHTSPGNITFSLLCSTSVQPKELLGLSLVTGIGVVSCLNREFGINAKLKWPNDVLVGDAKLGGLLTELSAQPSLGTANSGTRILTGIGINVKHDDFVEHLGIGGTSLEAVGIVLSSGDRDDLIGLIATSVLLAHNQFLRNGWMPFSTTWNELDWLSDREVYIHQDHSTEQVTARGVNEQGALLVERAGLLVPIYSGNVSIRPVA